MRVIYFLFLLFITLVGISFSMLNLQTVSINYYFAQSSLPLAMLLALTFFSGAILGTLIGFWLLMKSKVKQFRLRQRLNLAEKEIGNLRSIPLR